MTKPTVDVVCVVGVPRAGKDTFVEIATRLLVARDLVVQAESMIEGVVVGLLNGFGIDTSNKTPADRKLLVAVGNAVQDHSAFKSNWFFRRVERKLDALHDDARLVVFVQVREAVMVEVIREHFEDRAARVHVVRVTSEIAEKAFTDARERGLATTSDLDTLNVKPDVVIHNPYLGNDYGYELRQYTDNVRAWTDELLRPELAPAQESWYSLFGWWR